MNSALVVGVVFGAVILAMLGQGWLSWLEHKRRSQAMDLVKSALESGREIPPEVSAQLGKADAGRQPWSEVVVFTALSFGFWMAYAQAEGDQRTAFLVVAATMTVTAFGCLGLALMRPGRGNDDAG